MNEFISLFQYDFIIRAFVAAICIALLSPLVGTFLVVKRYSLMFDTLAHVALTGVAVGLLLQTSPVIAAIIATILGANLVEWLRQRGKLYGESVLAIFLSGSLAVAVVIISFADGFNTDLFSYLFGSITTVTTADMWTIIGLTAAVGSIIGLFYKQLYIVSFDEELAFSSGLRVYLLNHLVVSLAALTVAVSMRIVGVLLIGALMVIPVMTAIVRKKSFKFTLGFSIIIAQLSVIFGMLISYYYDIATGGAIVLTSLVLFLISVFTTKK